MQNATVIFKDCRKVELVTFPIPQPKEGELLLKSEKTLISQGTELAVLRKEAIDADSVWAKAFPYPYIPGYANVGVVADVGKGVAKQWIGKRVFSDLGHMAWGVKKAEEVFLVPDDISNDQMLISVFASIALCGVRRSRLKLGETAVVYGLGLIGQLVAQFCYASGALPVFCMERLEERRNLLPHPQRYVMASNMDEMLACIQEYSNGRMCDVAFEATGSGKLIQRETTALHPFGRLVIVSSPRTASEFHFHDFCNRYSYEIIGAHNLLHPPVETYENPWTVQREVELYLNCLRTGRIDVTGYVGYNASYQEAPKVYQDLLDDKQKALGVALCWDH